MSSQQVPSNPPWNCTHAGTSSISDNAAGENARAFFSRPFVGIAENSPLWESCAEVSKTEDDTVASRWTKKADTILLYAGVLCAIGLGSLIPLMRLPKPQINPSLLTPMSCCSAASFVSSCFVGSLILCKGYRPKNDDPPAGSAYQTSLFRQARREDLHRWRVDDWLQGLSSVLCISAALLLCAINLYVWMYQRIAALVMSALIGVGMLVFTVQTILPWLYVSCPYHTPIGELLSSLCVRLKLGVVRWLRRRTVARSAGLDIELFALSKDNPTSRDEEKTNALVWSSVSWLLTSSTSGPTYTLALCSIRTLPYIASKATGLLETNIPQELHSRALVQFDAYEGGELQADLNMDLMVLSYEYSLGYIHLLACLALDGSLRSPADFMVLIPSQSNPCPLDGKLLTQWRNLKPMCRSYDELRKKGWAPDTFAASLSAEALIWHLYPVNRDAISANDDDPLEDITILVGWHIKSMDKDTHSVEERRTLKVILGALVHTLGAMSSTASWARQRRHAIAKLLLTLIRSLTIHDFKLFRPLADCLALCSNTSVEKGKEGQRRRRRVLVENLNTARERRLDFGPGGGYRKLFGALTTYFKDDDPLQKSYHLICAMLYLAHMAPAMHAANDQFLRPQISYFAEILQHYEHSDVFLEWMAEFLQCCYRQSSSDLAARTGITSCLARITTLVSQKQREAVLLQVEDFWIDCLSDQCIAAEEMEGLCIALLDILTADCSIQGKPLLHRISERASPVISALCSLWPGNKNKIRELTMTWDSSGVEDWGLEFYNALRTCSSRDPDTIV